MSSSRKEDSDARMNQIRFVPTTRNPSGESPDARRKAFHADLKEWDFIVPRNKTNTVKSIENGQAPEPRPEKDSKKGRWWLLGW